MKVELLSPAGTYEALKASLNAGADAIYLGGDSFGARAYARNLTKDELLKAIDYVHVQGKHLYLTLNTLLKDNEIENELYEYLLPLYRQGLDAVIVQDMGVIRFIRTYFPDLPIHASTQMNITGIHGARYLQDLGISRVVTARELSLEEIKNINKNTSIEIECFIHGALCYCYSGQCLLSSILGGRSGNRGRCAGPCRLPYSVLKGNERISDPAQQYLLSLKDLCTLEILPEIINTGAASLKIEGRMKSAVYSAGVTSLYRKYIDLYLEHGNERYAVDPVDFHNLSGLYSRSGPTTGYYKTYNGRKLITLGKPGYVSSGDDFIKEIEVEYIKRDKQTQLRCTVGIHENKPVEIMINGQDLSVNYQGKMPSVSQGSPLTKETVLRQFFKTGTSEFYFSEIQVNLDSSLFLPISEINQLRRSAIEEYKRVLLSGYTRQVKEKGGLEPPGANPPSNYKINCLVDNTRQFEVLLEINEISAIYLEYAAIDLWDVDKFAKKAKDKNKKLYLALPQVFRQKAEKYFEKFLEVLNNSGLEGFLIRNLDEFKFFQQNSSKTLVLDCGLYALNKEAKLMYKDLGAGTLTLPLELNYKELKNRGCNNEELIVYGYLPLMVTAGCVKKTLNICDKRKEVLWLKDRYKKRFLIKNDCLLCHNTIYNAQPLSLLGVHEKVKELSVGSLRLNFTIETTSEVISQINKFIRVFFYDDENVVENQNYTRGHFNRKVE